MATFREQLREKREELGLSKLAVANAIGISDAYLGLIELGERHPSYPVVLKLEATLQFPPGELTRSWMRERHPELQQPVDSPSKRRGAAENLPPRQIEVFRSHHGDELCARKAGKAPERHEPRTGALRPDDLSVDRPRFMFVLRIAGIQEANVGFLVDDESMEPDFRRGDIAILDIQRTPANGDFILFRGYDELVIRKLVLEDGRRIVVPYHRDYTPEVLSSGDKNKILGVVTGLVRQFPPRKQER